MAIPENREPFDLFDEWYAGAQNCGLREPGAVALATADEAGRPSLRMVLLKGYDEGGFTFFTNLESCKGDQLRVNPYAALCFYWMPIGRQVRIEGSVTQVSAEEADGYFAPRHRDSQLGAWASRRSALSFGSTVSRVCTSVFFSSAMAPNGASSVSFLELSSGDAD